MFPTANYDGKLYIVQYIYSVYVLIILFHLNVAFKLQGLSAIFMALASTLSRYSALASVLAEIVLKATGRFLLSECCFQTSGTFLDTKVSVLGKIELKATSGRKTSE